MKLQCVETRHGTRVYEKFQVVIPTDVVQEVGCRPRDEVSFIVDRKKRVVMTFSEPKPKAEKMTFEAFREILFRVLVRSANGLTYSDIYSQASALPKKPSALWVRRLEETGWLERDRDPETYRRIWKLRLGRTDAEKA